MTPSSARSSSLRRAPSDSVCLIQSSYDTRVVGIVALVLRWKIVAGGPNWPLDRAACAAWVAAGGRADTTTPAAFPQSVRVLERPGQSPQPLASVIFRLMPFRLTSTAGDQTFELHDGATLVVG